MIIPPLLESPDRPTWRFSRAYVRPVACVMREERALGGIMPDARALLVRMFEEIINQGRLEVADELFAEDFVDHGPLGDVHGREAFKGSEQQTQAAAVWHAPGPRTSGESSKTQNR
jgi:hypothetical protein